MQERKPDRRIQRTQQMLRQALISLILEKGYDAITVQDILDRANMGRSTFYAHFHDKEDLLLSGFYVQIEIFQKEFLQKAVPGADPAQVGREMSLFFFRHAATHQALFKAMVGGQGGKIIMDQSLKMMTGFIKQHLSESIRDLQTNLPLDVLAHYIASSYLSMLTWWLDHNMPYTPEQMDAFYQQLVFPGMREMLETK